MSNLIDIDSLSAEDMRAILKGFASTTDEKEIRGLKPDEKKQKSKRKQKRKKNKVVTSEEQPTVRMKRKASDPQKQKKGGKQGGRRGRRNKEFDLRKHREKRSRGRGKQKNFGQRENVDVSGAPRPDLFEERFGNQNLHKKDIAIDKLLSGGNQVSSRRPKVQYIEAECTQCEEVWEVLPHLVHRQDDGKGEKGSTGVSFVCDECSGNRR